MRAIGFATPFCPSSSKVKPMPEDMLPLKLFLRSQRAPRVLIASGVEEKRRDAIDRSAVQVERPVNRPFVDVNDRHYDGRFAGPLDALASGEDGAAVHADPSQAGCPRVALRDGVRGDQPERSAVPQQVERAAEEMRHQVGVAVALLVEL